MDVLYRTSAVAVGGRDGEVYVENTPLRFDLARPAAMGNSGKSEGFNPEQLFAAGYAACFGSALNNVMRRKRLEVPPPEVRVSVGIGRNEAGGYSLNADITATFKGVTQQDADDLVAQAHGICPYSNATRGNIEVNIAAIAE
jgi:osmotically inducible protein OsmC